MSVAAPALPVRAERLWAALLAATLLNLPLGSVYSFSVLLRPIEQELGDPALGAVAGLRSRNGGVHGGLGRRRLPVPRRPRADPGASRAPLLAAGGLAVAATASGLAQLLLGYGIVFGTGGGVAYILLQQGVNMLVRRRRGLVNGYIVSLYPMGAMIATPAFHACNQAFGWRTTLGGLAAVVVACGIAAALLARHSGARLVASQPAGQRAGAAGGAGPDLLQARDDVLPRRLGGADGAEPGARDRRRLWRGGRAGGGGHHRADRRDRAGAHQRRLAGRPLRGARRDVRGARAGACAAGC